MFVWKTSTVADAFTRHLPEPFERMREAMRQDLTDDALSSAFEPLTPISVDHGIMEHLDAIRCVSATFAWSDVGSFGALADHLPTDADQNAHRGQLVTLDAHRNVVFSEDAEELVALIGMDDVVVVRAGNRTLVAPRNRIEEVKALVALLGRERQ